jgi:hypothetical protein
MGRSEFDIELIGTLAGNRIAVTGKVEGAPQLNLQAGLTKQGELPRAN